MSDWDHIALVEPHAYLLKYFSEDYLNQFGVKPKLEGLLKDAKDILFIVARFGFISEKVEDFSQGRDSFQVFFLVTTLESVAKIIYKNKIVGSRKSVIQVFDEFISNENKSRLSNAFQYGKKSSFKSFEEVVHMLYDIRCDVAHESKYLGFSLVEEGSTTPTSTILSNITSHITLTDLRMIVYDTCLRAAESNG